MHTKELNGVSQANQAVRYETGEELAGDADAAAQFAAVLQSLLGTPNLSALDESIAGLVVGSVAAAPVEVQHVEEPVADESSDEEGQSVDTGEEKGDMELDREVKTSEEKDLQEVDMQAVAEVAAQTVAVKVDRSVAEEVDSAEEAPLELVSEQTREVVQAVVATEVRADAEELTQEFALKQVQEGVVEGKPVKDSAASNNSNADAVVKGPAESLEPVKPAVTAAVRNPVLTKESNPADQYAELQRALENVGEVTQPQAAEVAAPATAVPKSGEGRFGLAASIITENAARAVGASEGDRDGQGSGFKGFSGGPNSSPIGIAGSMGSERAQLARAKTGNAGALTPKNQAKLIEQMQDLLKRAAQNRDGNSISVRVDPPELGMVTVKITQRDNQLFARITPDSPEVEAVLRNRVEDLTHVLMAAGLRLDQVHVSIGRERSEAEAFRLNTQGADSFGQSVSADGTASGDTGYSGNPSSGSGFSGSGLGGNNQEALATAAVIKPEIEAGWVA